MVLLPSAGHLDFFSPLWLSRRRYWTEMVMMPSAGVFSFRQGPQQLHDLRGVRGDVVSTAPRKAWKKENQGKYRASARA